MALIKCEECGREISNKAAACPGCGAPVDAIGNSIEPPTVDESVSDEPSAPWEYETFDHEEDTPKRHSQSKRSKPWLNETVGRDAKSVEPSQESKGEFQFWGLSLAHFLCGLVILFLARYDDTLWSFLVFGYSIIVGALISPPIFNRILPLYSTESPPPVYVICSVIVVFLFTMTTYNSGAPVWQNEKRLAVLRESYLTDKIEILADINLAIEEHRFDDAFAQASKFSDLPEEEIRRLKDQAATGQRRQEEEQRKQEEKALYPTVKAYSANELIRNWSGYKRLSELDPSNELYQKKRDHYQGLIDERAKREKVEAARKERIEKNFSGWDGSHHYLKHLVKEALRDPNSFEHIETGYEDKGSYLLVTMTYRGRNGFGGMVVETVRARVSLDGRVLEVL